jgi:hypothetical protein
MKPISIRISEKLIYVHCKVLYMNLEVTRLIGRPKNRWQDEVREDGRLVGGKGWKRKGYITERNGRMS